ncbi:MAG TPA: magnesium transporter CorA family protein [Actinomycetota bacterium]|nr:magnesium transporter CorA family protein [Actinomycetota bacterium]
MLMAVCHSADTGWTKIDDLSKLSDLRAKPGNVLWAEADLAHLDRSDIEVIAEEFDLDELAVEDAQKPRQRPKVENYAGHQFVVFHQLDESDGQLEATQIACFVGQRYLLTIHAGAERTIEAAKQRWRAEQSRAGIGDPERLLHTLFDVVVDEYQDIADRLENEMEELEEIALDTPRAPLQRQLYSMKQKVARYRRYVLPAARIIDRDVRTDAAETADETRRLFRDVHDHLIRISEQIRNIDDLSEAVLQLSRSEQAAGLNEVNKRLSAWAAIFAVGTLIAGVYGMNFALVPKDQTLFGFWFAVGLMVVSGIILFWYFKRREWL